MPSKPSVASWGGRPRKVKAAASDTALDRFVSGKGNMVRINIQVPAELRARVKAGCAMEGQDIKDVITELLEKRFPS